jgi:hypothetical protein
MVSSFEFRVSSFEFRVSRVDMTFRGFCSGVGIGREGSWCNSRCSMLGYRGVWLAHEHHSQQNLASVDSNRESVTGICWQDGWRHLDTAYAGADGMSGLKEPAPLQRYMWVSAYFGSFWSHRNMENFDYCIECYQISPGASLDNAERA